ncbi:MAG: YicC family protein [Ignavibacteriaceae bacterium]
MIYSMTGYGKGSAQSDNFTAEAEIKSVNSRFLEIYSKLPPALFSKEIEIKDIVRSYLKRGKINLVLNLNRNDAELNDADIDTTKVKVLLNNLKKIRKAAGLKDKIRLDHLLYDRSFIIAGAEELSDQEFELLKDALIKALKSLLEMRKAEGNELAKDLKKRINTINKLVSTVESLSSQSVQEYYEKLKERVKSLLADSSINPERLDTELALLADKAEITEECVRLKTHTAYFLKTLEQGDEPGRKLNFICQEMNREANTISSKALSAEIIHNVVRVKEEIEKIREQIQNIE